jgi:ABC-type branched-subunit amino acid transport system substrate-binding protein
MACRRNRAAALVWLLLSCFLLMGAKKPLTPAETRGRQIYLKGESGAGSEIVAEIGGSAVAGSLMPCGNCHGPDGRGATEGGVTPSSLRWNDLSRPYEVTSSSGRKHSGYDRQSFGRAIAVGRDPAGNRIGEAMPHFRMSGADLDDLVAWLQRIGEDTEEGLTGDSIVIGALLPLRDPASSGSAIRAALAAYFESVNQAGTIFGRRIEFRVASLPADKAQRIQAVRTFLDEVQPFALVASFSSGFEVELDKLLREREVPLIGAYTPLPVREDPPNPEVFYLDAGLRGQSEALARFAMRDYGRVTKSLTLVTSGEEIYRQSAEAVRAVLKEGGWSAPEIPAGPAAAQALRRSRADVVLMLCSPEVMLPLLDATADAGPAPRFLVPGALADERALHSAAGRSGRLYLAYPAMPSDYEPAASQEYARLAESAKLPAQYVAAQLLALASARLLVNGLTECGRELSRPKLIGVLEGLYEFHTGFTPPVTFSAGRRVGFDGARIVTWDAGSGSLKSVSPPL